MPDFSVPIATGVFPQAPDIANAKGNIKGKRMTAEYAKKTVVNTNLRKWKYWCAVGITVVAACTRDSSYSTLCSGFTSKGD